MRTELADLQKKLGITFLYVTHDQSEAMVLGDRIVLLNDGYTIQIGSPPELYKRPLTQFSATFVGGANILTGNLQNPVSSDKLRIKTDFGVFDISAVEGVAKTAGEKVLFCIRPEWVVIDSANADSTKLNQFRGKIMSRQYYGKYIHYLVETAGGKISIETPDNLDFGSGSDVNVYFPPEKCVQVLQ
jgi:ABC-type Fe3+/spermidine/putrescine transport system ATPase subunit